MDLESRFTSIHQMNYWGGAEGPSGPNATMDATENLRSALPWLISDLGIEYLFDAPCGDFNWMRAVRPYLPVGYIGGDIVRPLIDQNTASYGCENTKFIHFDARRDAFPTCDLWLCRDLFCHLSFEDGRKVLENFANSEIPYALLSTEADLMPGCPDDIESGDWRPVSLLGAPFHLPLEPLDCFDDTLPGDRPRRMCIWSREQIAEALKR